MTPDTQNAGEEQTPTLPEEPASAATASRKRTKKGASKTTDSGTSHGYPIRVDLEDPRFENVKLMLETEREVATMATENMAKLTELGTAAIEKINFNRAELKKFYFGPLHHAVDCLALGLLTGHPVLFLGPAGTAKSSVARAWAAAFDGSFIYKQISPSTTPDKLFGKLDFAKFKGEGVQQYMFANRIPEAHIAVLDEIFNGSDFLFGDLYNALNEKVAEDADGTEFRMPLIQAIGLSNHLPSLSKFAPLVDRFVIICHIGEPKYEDRLRISEASDLIANHAQEKGLQKLSLIELYAARHMWRHVKVEDVELVRMHAKILEEKVAVSDRRRNYGKDVVRAAALMAGHKEVEGSDMRYLMNVFAVTEEDAKKAYNIVMEMVDKQELEVDRIVRDVEVKTAAAQKSHDSNEITAALEAIKGAIEKIKALEVKHKRDFGDRKKALQASVRIITLMSMGA